MSGHYKDVGERYAYQIPLEQDGFVQHFAFTYNGLYPKDFEFPKPETGWNMRRAIKEWIERHPEFSEKFEWKIVRANGYWRDLHGDFVYEVWVKERRL